jgi:hypothetical protein
MMKTYFNILVLAVLIAATSSIAQERRTPAPSSARRPNAGSPIGTNSTGDYASDMTVVREAQDQALEQAKQMLAEGENLRDRNALETAIKEMERAQSALEQARKSPDKLPAAVAAEQAAYQALLKVTPREYRMTQSRNRGQGASSGQPNQRQLDQLEMQREENRYETERQAAAPPNAQQREQLQTADRLKELAQRQQDLNERLRELQTALQAARTAQEREDVQRQLKRLRDEQRQMLAKVDELRQSLAQSPNASSLAEAREQLDQTRSDMQRAAEEMERQSASQALAAGTRAQQAMQNLREDLRRQTSSQFTEQMRQLRNQAREMSRQQDEIARGLDSLNNGERQSLDNTAERQQIVQQLARQQSALTNLLSGIRNVTEQSETTEPLLSRQLYDTLRRTDQTHTDNLLDMGMQLVDRGFLPQASQVEASARTNITQLRQSIERAAESVLGSEADALRYAQKELDDLTRQVEREVDGGTNSAARGAGQTAATRGQSNLLERAAARASGNQETNSVAGNGVRPGDNESQSAENNSQREQRAEGNPGGSAANNGNEQAQNPLDGEDNAAAGNNGRPGNRAGGGQQSANNNSSDQQANSTESQRAGQGQNGGNANGGGGAGGERLRQFVQQLGRGGLDPNSGGPITGNNFVNWSDRLSDVERVLDPADLRNQLATVRERVATLRADYRDRGRAPQEKAVREQILVPLTQVRVWLREELARQENANSLVPLDRDPVPENYSELVRKYYETLGSAQ